MIGFSRAVPSFGSPDAALTAAKFFVILACEWNLAGYSAVNVFRDKQSIDDAVHTEPRVAFGSPLGAAFSQWRLAELAGLRGVPPRRAAG